MKYFDVYYVLNGTGQVESVKASSKTDARETVKCWYPDARIIKAEINADRE